MDHHTFTQQYLEILRDTLDIGEEVSADPRDHWGNDTADVLLRRLQNLMNAHTDAAVQSTREAAKDQSYSFHFGLSPHLNETLKYAPLYTDHVVLQDIVYRTLLQGQNAKSGELAAQVISYVRNIVQWEPLIESGHVSILPSPLLWSSRIREFLQNLDVGPSRICSQSLCAAGNLYTTPFTDAQEYCRHMTELASMSAKFKASAKTGKVELHDPTVFDALNQGSLAAGDTGFDSLHDTNEELLDMTILSVGSQLFGEEDSGTTPKLYYLRDATYEEVIEMAAEFDGFRTKFNTIIEELARKEGPEILEIVDKSPERIEEEYKNIKQEMAIRRDLSLSAPGVAGLALSLPLFIQIPPQDLLTTALLLSNHASVQEILNLIIGTTGAISGAITMGKIAEELYSDEYDFYSVISELERPGVKNGFVESLTPV